MTCDKAVAPTDLRDYLRSQGWALLEEALADRLYMVENANFPMRQLTFPMDATADDYSESVDIVIAKLADMMGQTSSSILSKVRALKDDVVRLRVFSDGNDSTLPLSFASTLIGSTEKLLRAAACTVLRPRTYHGRLNLGEAAQFVDAARFGQTEEGSFVLKVACPIHAMQVQGDLEPSDSEEPFVRQVTLSLHRALSQLTSAIERDELDRLVDDLKRSPKPLVSSNLCEALSAMHEERADNSLDIAVDWSSLRMVNDRAAGRTIRIQRDYFSRIEEVRRELRPVELHEEDTFIGTVERLEGEMGQDGRRAGDVVLSLLLPDEGETVRARVTLSADDYERADRAHMRNGAYVLVMGRLGPGRQPRQLTHVLRFEVLAAR
ncbi:hypothetical protein [Cupriavidus pampae]|uniref:Uncharacterized protein n=1 Tax=Cupriavidus pampae TaxID=659251 RepID=A0ABM8Y238_9BURK|nr:hypothetical protein [Cupriavidus pampae]CAG9186687.1 hypothetical protein LMG32289_06581 [Cupriavidus pampae]